MRPWKHKTLILNKVSETPLTFYPFIKRQWTEAHNINSWKSEQKLDIWSRSTKSDNASMMQPMWVGLPGNMTSRTEAFIVAKNEHIHQTTHFLPRGKCLEISLIIAEDIRGTIPHACVHGKQWIKRLQRECWKEEGSHLEGYTPRLKTELTQIVSLRAWASSSLCTLPMQLGQPLCADLKNNKLISGDCSRRLNIFNSLGEGAVSYQIWSAHLGHCRPGTCYVWKLEEQLGKRPGFCCQFAKMDLHLQRNRRDVYSKK